MILTKEIKIKVAFQKVKYYRELGYDVKAHDVINVKVEHLSPGSNNRIQVKCDICGKEKDVSYRKYLQNINNGSGLNLYTCSVKCSKIKSKNTCMQKYGVDNPWKDSKVRTKCSQTKEDRYGDKNYNNRDQAKETCLEKYNVINPGQIEEVKDKIVNTMNERYGVNYYTVASDFKEKSERTSLKNYGTKHPMQNQEYFNKHQEHLKKWKNYTYPSGNIIKIQGYENKVIDDLLKMGYKENDIITKSADIRKLIGTIKYTYNGKTHLYFPDIYLKSDNRIIEVKSMYIFKLHKERNLAKRKACLARNLKFNFLFRL